MSADLPHAAVNRQLWDALAPQHAASSYYDVESFLAGRNALGEIEVAEVGDVTGKRMAHLMCHFGMDTLSWAWLGAEVTGVDFSDEAIAIARGLADRTGTAAHFVSCDVMDAPGRLEGTYDIVFLSRGILMWVEDVPAWARVCAQLLAPGGMFYLLDIHPLAMAIGNTGDGLIQHGHYFSPAEPSVVRKPGSYAVRDVGLGDVESREWNHSLGEIVTALAEAGIRIDFLHEFPGPESEAPGLPELFSVRGHRS